MVCESVRSLVIVMDSCSELVDRSPVRTSSTHRLFSTPYVVDDGGHATQSIVTPVTQAALDPLVRPALQTPPLSITPTSIETPPDERYTHISMLFFVL
jgi:hypothetical protein